MVESKKLTEPTATSPVVTLEVRSSQLAGEPIAEHIPQTPSPAPTKVSQVTSFKYGTMFWLQVAPTSPATQHPRKSLPGVHQPPLFRGKIYCGPIQACSGKRFLMYTEYGGKVIRVKPTQNTSTADIAKLVKHDVQVAIEGIEEKKWRNHAHDVPADRIRFLGPSEDTGQQP